INEEVDRCDIFLLVLHRRWGQPAPDAVGASSYTEEEFRRAQKRWQRTKAPKIYVLLKYIDPANLADPGPQLVKVVEFRQQLEREGKTLTRTFSNESDFREEVNIHLRKAAKSSEPAAKRVSIV